MRQRFAHFLSLGAFPTLASATVLLLIALTLGEITRQFREDGTRIGIPGAGHLAPEGKGALDEEDLSREFPELSQREALARFTDAPSWHLAERLFADPRHRDRLYKFLIEERRADALRVFVLGRFAELEPERALAAAREIIAADAPISDVLRFALYETLARSGAIEDLAAFDPRAGESYQARSVRERHRLTLEERLLGRTEP
jgi:hypothetical protein